jgi:predicted permease
MKWWRRILDRRGPERLLDAELRDHLDRLTADYVRSGFGEAEARRRARLAFGGIEQIKESCRDVRRTRPLQDLVQDLRYAVRLLRQSPAFTAVAVCSLALGIGANSAIFALVDDVLLRSLPVRDPERLVLLDRGSWTNPIWEQIRDRRGQLFEDAMAWSEQRFDLSRGGRTEFVEGLWVSGSFFEVLGVPAAVGRTLTSADDRRGGGPDGAVAVISHRFWHQRFGGSPDVIGRPVTLDRVPFTIVGVTPPRFFGPRVGSAFDVAVPLGAQLIVRGREHWLDARSTWVLNVMARLRPAQSIDDATRALRSVQPQIRQATMPPGWSGEFAAQYLSEAFTLIPAAAGPRAFRTRYERPLLIMTAVVGLVLLIACANVASLTLARAAGRRHEFSMRLALGATRARLARQLLAESLLLAAVGAALGLLFAQWGSHVLVAQLSTPRNTVALDLSLDPRIVLFTAVVSATTAVLFGIAPALRARRVQPNDALKEHGRTVAGEGSGRFGGVYLVAQVAFSLVLIVAAGLFLRTFVTLTSQDLGFDREALLVVDVNASRSPVEPEHRRALFDRVRAAAAGVPGVSAAAISWLTPVSGSGWNGRIELPDRPDLTGRAAMSFFNSVTPGWFAAYGTAIRAGREFTERDAPGAPPVAVVNEAFVRTFFRDGQAIGRMVPYRRGPSGGAVQVEIVGVVEDAAYRSVRDPVPPTLYFPFAQAHADGAPEAAGLGVRATAGSPALLVRALADAIAQVDPDLALTFRPLDAFVDGALAQERMLALLSGFFGALALILAAIGIYGTTSYAVSRRLPEIGVRMALGADSSGVVWLVLRRVLVPVGMGVVLGSMLSVWASGFVETLLYGLEPRDPLTFAGAGLILTAIAAVAAWLPARRAARIDPVRVLRAG